MLPYRVAAVAAGSSWHGRRSRHSRVPGAFEIPAFRQLDFCKDLRDVVLDDAGLRRAVRIELEPVYPLELGLVFGNDRRRRRRRYEE